MVTLLYRHSSRGEQIWFMYAALCSVNEHNKCFMRNTSEGMDKQRKDEIAGYKEHRGRGNGEDLWRRQRKGGSLTFMAHLSLFRRCSNDATHSHKNILSWLWFSHATSAALIVLPLFDSRFGATQSDVYVAKCILEQQLMKSCFGKNWV